MVETINFITGSKFRGDYRKALRHMDGFGIYIFPDKSQYAGYLHRGKFHGYGSLSIYEPIHCVYKGVFKEGTLVELDGIYFGDGLEVEAKLTDGSIDMSDWAYCKGADRRTYSEVRKGLEAIIPLYSFHDAFSAMRLNKLAPHNFDTLEGIYNSKSGFLIFNKPLPLRKGRFISCPAEEDWIKANCRVGIRQSELPSIPGELTNAEVEHTIIQTNLKSEAETPDSLHAAPYADKPAHKHHLPKQSNFQCKAADWGKSATANAKQPHFGSSDSMNTVCLTESNTLTCSSVTNPSLEIQLTQNE